MYHHILTLFATWLGLLTNTTFQWIGVVTNTLVHTVMYYYYLRTTLDPDARIWWKVRAAAPIFRPPTDTRRRNT